MKKTCFIGEYTTQLCSDYVEIIKTPIQQPGFDGK